MKTKVMAAAALCCMMTAFTACTNDDNPVVPSSGDALITVNTSALYDELNIAELMPQWLNSGKITIIDSVLIYDEAGDLMMKLGAEASALQPQTFEAGNLSNGIYTLVAWQTARQDNGKVPWLLSGEEKLSTVSLSATYSGIPYPFALGYASTTVTVEGGNLETTVSPKSLGSIIELRVDNFTEDKGYSEVYLSGGNSQYVVGCRLDPSLTGENRWIMESKPSWNELVGRLKVGTGSEKFFTLSHGNKVWFDLYGVKDKFHDWLLDGGYNLGTGENVIYYFDMSRLRYQPTFFGTYEDFAVWKADRDNGLLVVDPYLNWGGSFADVDAYVTAKQWWLDGNNSFELWEGLGWHRWYYVANLLTEQYLFETEDGQNLRVVLSICHDSTVPIDLANQSLLKQGYEYKGKFVYPGNEPCDIFFSADGQTEVQTILWPDGRWEIFYQPTDPNDFQYIVPADARSIGNRSDKREVINVPTIQLVTHHSSLITSSRWSRMLPSDYGPDWNTRARR